MKKLLIGIALLIIAGEVFAQTQPQLVVAVSPFEVRGGFTQDEADVITELFAIELAAAGTVKVVDRGSFDKIRDEMRFQVSDWSDGNKVAQFGKALNANSFIRGQMMKLGDQLVITASIVDVNTTQILSTSRMQLAGVNEVTGKLPAFARGIVENLPKPPPPPPKNHFVGKWRAVYQNWKGNFVCIMDIRENGTVIVERYDTMSYTTRRKRIGKAEEIGTPLRTGSGTGAWFMDYTDEESQTISVALSLKNVPDDITSINTSSTIGTANANYMSFPYSVYTSRSGEGSHASYGLQCFFHDKYLPNGSRSGFDSDGGYVSFSRIQ